MQPLARASVVRIPRDAHSLLHPVAASVRGACTPFSGCRLYRPRGKLFQLLLECVGLLPPPASVVCAYLAERSLSVTSCCYVTAWGLYPLPRVSSVPTQRDAFSAGAGVRGACTAFHERRLDRPRGTITQFHNLSLLECLGPVPPSTCIVFTGTRGTLFQALLECVWPVRPFATVVYTNLAGSYFSFASCRCLSAWGPCPLPRVSSEPTPQDAH